MNICFEVYFVWYLDSSTTLLWLVLANHIFFKLLLPNYPLSSVSNKYFKYMLLDIFYSYFTFLVIVTWEVSPFIFIVITVCLALFLPLNLVILVNFFFSLCECVYVYVHMHAYECVCVCVLHSFQVFLWINWVFFVFLVFFLVFS